MVSFLNIRHDVGAQGRCWPLGVALERSVVFVIRCKQALGTHDSASSVHNFARACCFWKKWRSVG